MADQLSILRVAAADTYPIRREVLRNGDPDAAVASYGDSTDRGLHLVAVAGDPIGVVSIAPRAFPFGGGEDHWQLFGMAVIPSHQGTGVGRRLLQEALNSIVRSHGTLVWAKARDTALGFYQRQAFSVVGAGFEHVGLPHHLVVWVRACGDLHEGSARP